MNGKDLVLYSSLLLALASTQGCGGGGGGSGASTLTPVNSKPVISLIGASNPVITQSENIMVTYISTTDADNDPLTTTINANGTNYNAQNHNGIKRGIYSGNFTLSTTDGKDTASLTNFNPIVVADMPTGYKITGLYTNANDIPGVNNLNATDITSLLTALQTKGMTDAYTAVNTYATNTGIANIVDTWYSPDANYLIFSEKQNGQLVGVPNGVTVYEPLKLKQTDQCGVAKIVDPLYICPP